MTTDSRNADLTAHAIAATDRLGAALREALAIAEELRATLSTPFEGPFNAPSNTLQTREQIYAAHGSAHRMGVPGKIESDPELQAFIAARIGTMTCAQVVAEVKSHFPAARQPSLSAVQRWFRNVWEPCHR